GILIGVGRASGLGWDEIGLDPTRLRRGLRIGARAAAAAGGAALLALSLPEGRSLLRDERATLRWRGSVWRRALIRFPLGTALFEEAAFRGVLPALLERSHRPMVADSLSAGIFALWHLIPTRRALAGHPLGSQLSGARRMGTVVAGSVAAGCFGLVFSSLRRRTGSLAAPWLAHASLNSLWFLAGVAALKAAAGETRPGEG
ncbi:MAG: CPBP family intramembrane metalloprotease, partial [Actinobacteria bacterium]|nr:CPBP family intramembrane metalloprotease [Actinomycetota bacterium]